MFNIELVVNHIPGSCNVVADLLSRWQGTISDFNKLRSIIPEIVWIPVHIDLNEVK